VGATFGDVDYTGDAGVNNVVFTDAAAPVLGKTRVTISEAGVVAMAPCVQMGANAAYCDISDSDRVDITLGADNDVATNNGTRVSDSMNGGPGDDMLTGADAEQGAFFFPVADNLNGGEGRDTLSGRSGNDGLSGEEGDDLVEGGQGEDNFSFSNEDGSDILRGGPGFDRVFTAYDGPDPPLGATVDLAAGTAIFAGLSAAQLESIEDAQGDDGPDTLLGTAGINVLSGDDGNDTIDGRAGPDRLEGEQGDDLLKGQDGFADILAGGSGTDTCDADQLDTREGCEAGSLVSLPPFGTPAPPDRLGPRCKVRGVPARKRAKQVRRKGVRFTATCDEAGRVAARLLVKLKRAGRRSFLSRAGDLELATGSRSVTAGKAVRLRLRVSPKLRRLVRRGVRLRLELRATDAAANERTTTRRVRLR
jgi:hypothetical protein